MTSATEAVSRAEAAYNAYDTITGPRTNAVNEALDVLFLPFTWPLLQILEMCTGDPDQLHAHSRAWIDAAKQLQELAVTQKNDLVALRSQWKGQASEAYAKRVESLIEGLEQSATEMAQTADALGDSAKDLVNAEEVIKTLIRELVEFFIITQIASAVLDAVTAGAAEAAKYAEWAAATGVQVSRATKFMAGVNKVLEAYKSFMAALKGLGTLGKVAAWTLDKFYGPKAWIKKGIKLATGIDGSIAGETGKTIITGVAESAADEYDDRKSGVDGDGSRWRRGVSSVVDPIADRT